MSHHNKLTAGCRIERVGFETRRAAGDALGERLVNESLCPDRVVTIPDGGYPVAATVADTVDVPLAPIIAEHVPAPDSKQLAVGAVAADGTCWRNDDIIERRDLREAEVERALDRAQKRTDSIAARYGTGMPSVMSDESVVLVDDGLRTGAAATVSLRALQRAGASDLCLAVPVAASATLDRLRSELECDRAIALETPASIESLDPHYEQFPSISH